MITNNKFAWQDELSNIVTDPVQLWDVLALDRSLLADAILAAKLFPLKVTQSYLARMQPGNRFDPLLLQVLPQESELQQVPGFVRDPLQEQAVNPVPGLLHKYHGRVLVTLTSACAVHCRYCFRRHFPYAENNPGRAGWEKIFAYIENDASIHEVILSGGDPLSVSDHLLRQFTDRLQQISHVKTLRIHTRLPIVLPTRVTEAFCQWLRELRLQVVIVVHSNHAQEINEEVRQALQSLRDVGVTLLNQSVLLKNVNDDAATLIALSEALFAVGVLPYYLHTLDKVEGAQHFDFPKERALALHAEITAQLPGYLVPRLVCEEAGAKAKTAVTI